MEMEYKDPPRRGLAIILLGVVLALVAGGAAFLLVTSATNQGDQEVARTTAVVAAVNIPARKPIEQADLAVRTDVPVDAATANIVADPAQLLGRILAVDVAAGQLITTNLLASTTAGGQFSILGANETVAPDSEAWRAVSILVPDDRAVGGALGPSMTVDVFVTAIVQLPQELLTEGIYVPERTTKVTYQDMVILARTGQMYIVKATLQVAEEISHLQAAGNVLFSLALRPEIDTRVLDVSGLGATTNRIIQRYGLPVPLQYPPAEGTFATPPPIPAITPRPTAAP